MYNNSNLKMQQFEWLLTSKIFLPKLWKLLKITEQMRCNYKKDILNRGKGELYVTQATSLSDSSLPGRIAQTETSCRDRCEHSTVSLIQTICPSWQNLALQDSNRPSIYACRICLQWLNDIRGTTLSHAWSLKDWFDH